MEDAPTLEVIRGAERASTLLNRTRRELVEQLTEPDSASGLARRLGLPRQRINYHLRELERQGLVECVEERRKGNCTERLVRATARSFGISPEALGLVGSSHASQDRGSAAYLMGAAARTLQDVAALDARARHEGKTLATLTLEADVRFASAASRAAFASDLADAVARLVARHHDARAPGGRPFRIMTCIHPAASNTASPARPAGGAARRRKKR